jgi:hypothetical protein
MKKLTTKQWRGQLDRTIEVTFTLAGHKQEFTALCLCQKGESPKDVLSAQTEKPFFIISEK